MKIFFEEYGSTLLILVIAMFFGESSFQSYL